MNMHQKLTVLLFSNLQIIEDWSSEEEENALFADDKIRYVVSNVMFKSDFNVLPTRYCILQADVKTDKCIASCNSLR